MSVAGLRWAASIDLPTPYHRVVLIYLANSTWNETYVVKQSTIATNCKMSPRKVRDVLGELESEGLISRSARFSKASGNRGADKITLAISAEYVTQTPFVSPDKASDPTHHVRDIARAKRHETAGCLPAPDAAQSPMFESSPSQTLTASPSESGQPAKKPKASARPTVAAKQGRPPRWTDKPLAERMSPHGIPEKQDGDPDWNAMIWEVQLPKLLDRAKVNGITISGASARARIGKLIKRMGVHDASIRIRDVLKAEPGGNPLDYCEGIVRAAKVRAATPDFDPEYAPKKEWDPEYDGPRGGYRHPEYDD